MKLPRITIGRLMFLVALVGISLGFWAWMARRSAAFWAKAEAHAERARQVSYSCRIDSKLLEHHESLSSKYKQAARSPWLPVAPDPSEPR